MKKARIISVWGAKTRGAKLQLVGCMPERQVMAFLARNSQFYACLEADMPKGEIDVQRVICMRPRSPLRGRP